MHGNGREVVHRYLLWAAILAGILVVVMGLFTYLATS